VHKHHLPSRKREGKSPSGEITTGPSGKAFPSCKYGNKDINKMICFLKFDLSKYK
jgi:hypothetical protein